MDEAHNEAPLSAELRELEAARAADRAAEQRAANVTRAVAAGLFLIVAVFALVNYLHVRGEWTEENLEASLRQELDALEVEANVQLEALGERLLPVYADESLRQFQELSPEIARRFVDQFERLGVDLQAETRAQLVDTEARVRQRTAALLLDTFPDLQDETRRSALEHRLYIATDDAVDQALAGFHDRFSGDVHELEAVVMSFDVADSDEPTVELQKRFLRCWLQLLDQEIAQL